MSTKQTLLERAKERFANDEKLRVRLDVLNEYIFPDDVLIQLIEKSNDAVWRFCAAVDE